MPKKKQNKFTARELSIGMIIGLILSLVFPILTFTVLYQVVLIIAIVFVIVGVILLAISTAKMKSGTLLILGYSLLLIGVFWLVYLVIAFLWSYLVVFGILGGLLP